jgi:hypothetical protein
MELNNHVVSADGLAGKHAIEGSKLHTNFLGYGFCLSIILNYRRLLNLMGCIMSDVACDI